MKSLRFLIPFVIFALLAVFFYIGLGRNPGDIPSPLIGKPAPPFSLPSVQDPNKQVSTADYQGHPYVVNVWATWCAGCRDEHETLLTISQTNTVPLIGIDWKDDRDLAQRWLTQLGNPYHAVAFDPEGRVAIDWGVYGAPETFLVDANGSIAYKHVGPMTPDIWKTKFLPRISQGATP